MKENSQAHRINYSNAKHHRQLIREQIDPQLVNQIQASPQPSLNYKNAFKNAYIDELGKTLRYQQDKKVQQQVQSTKSFVPCSLVNAGQSIAVSPKMYRPVFTDYDEDRHQKFDDLINKNFEKGSILFKAQDQYQLRKQQQSLITSTLLQQQLVSKQQKKLKENQHSALIAEEVRQNRLRQVEAEQERESRVRQNRKNDRMEMQSMIQKEQMRKQRRSYHQLGEVGRHNPITNPIEYHIDNPYILHQIQKNNRY